MRYILFIGYFNPFNNGQKRQIDSILKSGKSVCVCIIRSDDCKYPSYRRIMMVASVYKKEILEERVRIISIPDIEDVVTYKDDVSSDVPPEVEKLIDQFEAYDGVLEKIKARG